MKFRVKPREVVPVEVVKPPIEEIRELIKVDGKLADIYNAAEAMQAKCKDFIVKDGTAKNLSVFSTGIASKIQYCHELNETRQSEITPYALGQLCARIGVPYNYIKKCQDKRQYALIDLNLNTWLNLTGKNYLIREHDHIVRGVLSPRYSAFDTVNIIREIMSTDLRNMEVKGHFLSPERFHLRLVEDRKLFKADDLSAGIQIDSSDVGRALLRVQFLIFKQICTNGLVMPVEGSTFFAQNISA